MATTLLLLTDRGKQDCSLFGMIEGNPNNRRHRAKPLSEFTETSRPLEEAQKLGIIPTLLTAQPGPVLPTPSGRHLR